MDCMQFKKALIAMASFKFQYRRRYGLHAIRRRNPRRRDSICFNTASGMDCMQSASRCSRLPVCQVSIPQAVRIACNATSLCTPNNHFEFQYRKRYGLHAINWVKGLLGRRDDVSIPQAVRIACNGAVSDHGWRSMCFNTASGTDCMQ